MVSRIHFSPLFIKGQACPLTEVRIDGTKLEEKVIAKSIRATVYALIPCLSELVVRALLVFLSL